LTVIISSRNHAEKRSINCKKPSKIMDGRRGKLRKCFVIVAKGIKRLAQEGKSQVVRLNAHARAGKCLQVTALIESKNRLLTLPPLNPLAWVGIASFWVKF